VNFISDLHLVICRNEKPKTTKKFLNGRRLASSFLTAPLQPHTLQHPHAPTATSPDRSAAAQSFARPILGAGLLAEFCVLFYYRPANAGHIKMWDSIPNWIRYGAVVIAIIFIAIAIWYMSQ
jgi:protein-S-isoprenylcysteine O-methyltransferase Ste14